MDHSQLKFGNFKVGNKIRAFDFQPCVSRDDCFVVGIIKRIANMPGQPNCPSYHIVVVADSTDLDRTEIFVPMQALYDFDERVTLVEK